MKLYDVPNNTVVRTTEDSEGPPGEPTYLAGLEVMFHDVDGMYSRCTVTTSKRRVYLKAWTEVEIVPQ